LVNSNVPVALSFETKYCSPVGLKLELGMLPATKTFPVVSDSTLPGAGILVVQTFTPFG